METVAPAELGFRHDLSEGVLTASGSGLLIRLHWPDLTLLGVETYFERRHHDPAGLMERVATESRTSAGNAIWRRMGVNVIGARELGAMVVGVDLTQTVRQVFYAKTRDRIRAETRYHRAVRNALRVTRGRGGATLSNLLDVVRSDASGRVRWDLFCLLCDEPQRALLSDLARFAAVVAESAERAGVNVENALSALLISGGVTVDAAGFVSEGFVEDLVRAGIAEVRDIRSRRAPGEARRVVLKLEWADMVQRLQRAFATTATSDPE